MDAALAEIQRVDKLMTRFSPSSDIGRVNMSAPGTWVPVSKETASVVATGIEWAQSSDGAFDPGVAKIVELWDVVHRHEPPPVPQVKRLANRKFYQHIDTDPSRGLIKLEGPDLAIDLGGIPPGVTLTDVKVWLVGGTGATHSAMPATKPKASFYRKTPALGGSDAGATSLLAGPTTDGSANVAAYEVLHVITFTPGLVVLTSGRYYVMVEGETGANSVAAALQIVGVSASWTAP
jgi:hypothetical protein